MTTRQEIKGWLERGKKNGATHMIVVCDSYDYEDYPVYVMPGDCVKKKCEQYNGKNMQRIMEVYSLKQDIDEQVNTSRRVFNYD